MGMDLGFTGGLCHWDSVFGLWAWAYLNLPTLEVAVGILAREL